MESSAAHIEHGLRNGDSTVSSSTGSGFYLHCKDGVFGLVRTADVVTRTRVDFDVKFPKTDVTMFKFCRLAQFDPDGDILSAFETHRFLWIFTDKVYSVKIY